MTGTRASKNAILISSFCVASSSLFTQLGHASPEEQVESVPVVSIWIGSIFLWLLFIFIFIRCPIRLLGFAQRVLRKKKRALDNDVRTRFSFLNIYSIAQKKHLVNSCALLFLCAMSGILKEEEMWDEMIRDEAIKICEENFLVF